MSGTLRLRGSTSGYSELQAPAVAADQTFVLPTAGGTLLTTDSPVPQLTLQLGSASEPSLRFQGDLDTGLFSQGTNTLNLVTGGSSKVVLGADAHTIYAGTGASVRALDIDSSGQVGIGTTSPDTRLHVNYSPDNSATLGTNAGATMLVENTSSNGIANIKLANGLNADGHAIVYGTTTSGSLRIMNQSAERMRIDSSGNIGIGKTNPAVLLDLGTATPIIRFSDTDLTGYHQIQSSNSNFIINADPSNQDANSAISFKVDNSEAARIDSSGRLLVGTTTSLDTGGLFQVKSNTDGIINYYEGDNATPVRLRLTKSRGATTAAVDDDGLGEITFRGRATGNSLRTAASISGEVDDTPGATSVQGRLVFSTAASGASSPTERMRIDSSGSVGIGVTDAGQRLVVGSASNTTIRIDNADDSTAKLYFHNSGSTDMDISVTDSEMTFNSGSSNERMKIDSSGRLLVGASSAIASGNSIKLHLVDNAGAKIGIARNDTSTAANNTIGSITFYGNDSNGTYEGCAQISCLADEAHGTGNKPSRLVFSTTPSGSSDPSYRMQITNKGASIFAAGSATGSGGSRLINNNDVGFVNDATYGQTLHFGNTYGGLKGYVNFYYNSTTSIIGTISAAGSTGGTATGINYNTSSDYRLKENVVNIVDGISRVKQLQPRRFNFIVDADRTVDGFIAHEAQTVVPEAVTGSHNEVNDEGNPVYQGIDQAKLVPLLTAALQEAIAKIETLETKVAALEAGN